MKTAAKAFLRMPNSGKKAGVSPAKGKNIIQQAAEHTCLQHKQFCRAFELYFSIRKTIALLRHIFHDPTRPF